MKFCANILLNLILSNIKDKNTTNNIEMTNYSLNRENIFLPTRGGRTIILTLTKNSGRIAYRDKINTIIGIKHPGIELGIDQYGYRWFVHHHYKNRKPAIEREDEFSLGVPIFYDDRPVSYNQYEILERAIAAWWEGKEYQWLWQNCQHFVNEIARKTKVSDTVERVSDNVIAGGGVTALIGFLTGNKGLVRIGLGVAGAGVVGKGLSRMK